MKTVFSNTDFNISIPPLKKEDKSVIVSVLGLGEVTIRRTDEGDIALLVSAENSKSPLAKKVFNHSQLVGA